MPLNMIDLICRVYHRIEPKFWLYIFTQCFSATITISIFYNALAIALKKFISITSTSKRRYTFLLTPSWSSRVDKCSSSNSQSIPYTSLVGSVSIVAAHPRQRYNISLHWLRCFKYVFIFSRLRGKFVHLI